MVLTRELINNLRTENGNVFTSETLKHLGLSFKNVKKGWTFALIGTFVNDQSYQKAFEGRKIFRKKGDRQCQIEYEI
jgi:hypothetical protein